MEVAAETVPLVQGADGVMLLRGTRIPLETVFAAFRQGATAEEILQQYPALSLADVYQVIAYCQHHPSQLQAYLDQRQDAGRAARFLNESEWPPDGIRERLLARRLG
ncbi:MAG: DUF433 domain-containing protein [Bryobacteraceae bacterium]